ncbi:unnamed protein product [Paramecium octaurelia]|uniref:Uncharacterized protein n=1 Tax=Paramecium octaurelia TaxID=43137 RepID=A0A8S1YLI4_PAROT|nr:unnamed protein product [Paramecium octaurelia]
MTLLFKPLQLKDSLLLLGLASQPQIGDIKTYKKNLFFWSSNDFELQICDQFYFRTKFKKDLHSNELQNYVFQYFSNSNIIGTIFNIVRNKDIGPEDSKGRLYNKIDLKFKALFTQKRVITNNNREQVMRKGGCEQIEEQCLKQIRNKLENIHIKVKGSGDNLLQWNA